MDWGIAGIYYWDGAEFVRIKGHKNDTYIADSASLAKSAKDASLAIYVSFLYYMLEGWKEIWNGK